jgi:hypothetical protein
MACKSTFVQLVQTCILIPVALDSKPVPKVICADMPFQPGHKLAGNRKGKPNRATRDAREAIARFVDRNAPKLQRWLDAVSDGLREPDLPGPPDENGNPTVIRGKWIVTPDPERAFVLFQSVIEYHVPKLSRREVVKDPGGPSRVIDSSQLTAEQREQLRQMILAQAEPAQLEVIPANGLEPVGLAVAQVIEQEPE